MSGGGRVAVIGGGYTGLVAALRLAQAGHQVTVYEASPVVGGLASGFSIEDAPLERAYHHLFRTDTSIANLARELGLALTWHDSSQALYYDGTLYPFAGALDLLRFRPLKFRNRLRAGFVVLYLQRTKRWARFEGVTALEWMRRAAGEQVSNVIWEPLLRGKFHHFYDKVSMAWLWARVHVRANSREKGGLREQLGYFDGGFEVFTDALVARLRELGVEILTSAPVGSLRTGAAGVTLKHADTEVRFDAAVATVPSGAFARLIDGADVPDGYVEQLTSIDYLAARLLIFSSDQQLSDTYWHNINDVGLPFLVFINHTQLVGTQVYGGRHVYYIATYVPDDDELFQCPDEQLQRLWFSGLREVFPQFDESAVREIHHFRFRNAQHIVGTDYSERIPAKQTPLPHVFLSNFSQIYPEDRGTNFAVRDGEAIADLVRKDLEG